MDNNSLFDRCRVNTNIDDDVFVGISKKDGMYEVSFPLGYHLDYTSEKRMRKDILSLMSVLSKYSDKKLSELKTGGKRQKEHSFPVQAYLHIIQNYFENGYYKEKETLYANARRGKIDWSRTIKTQKPVIQGDEAYYLNFIVKKKSVNENELITLVHKYCVYESFDKLGWLFTSFVPQKPALILSNKRMISVVNDKLQNTFNDKNKLLFRSMLDLLKFCNDDENTEFKYGTNRFEYIWEKMIDKMFGIEEKEFYFPKTFWNLEEKGIHENAYLEPDTIMIKDDKVYVLDAKYYKYGWSGAPGHLPESTSINKQITYGEYIAESKKFMKSGKHPIVYNAFIMPYDSKGKRFPTNKPIHYIGTATSDWKDGSKEYEQVVGLLMDMRYLMEMSLDEKDKQIEKLVNMIEDNSLRTRRRFHE